MRQWDVGCGRNIVRCAWRLGWSTWPYGFIIMPSKERATFMATIYKRTRSKSLPGGARIETRRGVRYAVWTDADGNVKRQKVNLDETRIVAEANKYTIEYFDQNGKRRRVSAETPDRDAAVRFAAKLENDAMLRRNGIIDASHDRFATQNRRSIRDHLAEFVTDLRSRGNTAQHCTETCEKVRVVVDRCRAEYISDLTASAVQRAIGDLRNEGRSLKTCNHYLAAIKNFSAWMRRDKRSKDDALESLERFNADADPKRIRRELTPDEARWLLAATETRTLPEHKISGPDRAMLYRLALGTGFRAGELRSLTPKSFDLDGDPPTVTVDAAHSKRRRRDCQPIGTHLAAMLGDFLDGRPPKEKLFAKLPLKTARMLRSDLAAARASWIEAAGDDERERERREKSDFLKYENSAGEVFDFHGTRHTYISGIVNGGASVKVAQELARHSTPTLTIGRYAHTRLHDLRGALEGLPDLTKPPSGPESEPASLRRTGSDDVPIEAHPERSADSASDTWAHFGAQSGGDTWPEMASGGEAADDENELVSRRNVLAINAFGNEKTTVASGGERYPLGESNPCSRAENPVSWATRRRGRRLS